MSGSGGQLEALRTFAEFAAELGVQESLYKSLVAFGKKPAAS